MFDVIVVGGGHAGIEATLSAARRGFKTCLVTLDFGYVGSMPCNPSIGGPAKGVVVREIDALGGEMAKAADATYLQMKMLNTAKGPGVQCLRVQSDKLEYRAYMQDVLKHEPNVSVIEDMVKAVIVEDKVCKGVVLEKNGNVHSKTVILTTGTNLSSRILRGHKFKIEGPDQQRAAYGLSDSLRDNGIRTLRLKTGTPARLDKFSIDYSKMEVQTGTESHNAYSYSTKKFIPVEEQEVCYLIHTNKNTHNIILDNIGESAMYGGIVEGVGPRYCPSIEDKLMRFKDKEQHQLFLEPESVHLDTVYLQGFSTSMPEEIQDKMIHSLEGLENVKIVKYAYAIEYDGIDPLQLKYNLELRDIENLFCAGQINGTSGYEEAAGQGLMAGINATLKIEGKEPFILKRDESYIGVLIDDLVTKGTKEPYRLLTSRAEYRLLLRHDNADIRLMKYGHQFGLISDEQFDNFLSKEEDIEQLSDLLKSVVFSFKHPINEVLKENNIPVISESSSAYNLLKRPFVTLKMLIPYLEVKRLFSDDVIQEVEILVKYEGYIKKQKDDAANMRRLEDIKLDINTDYDKVDNLALEARQKLNKIKPENIGQASRISGVNPADISILIMHMKLKGEKING